jgi:two-component system cell cycle sensor histidine kinase/response regulator CckA
MTEIPTPHQAETHRRWLPAGTPWRSKVLWFLVVLAAVMGALALLLLGGSQGPLRLVDMLPGLPFNADGDTTRQMLAGAVAFLIFLLLLGSAYSFHRTLRDMHFLWAAFGSDAGGRALSGPDGTLVHRNAAFSRMVEGEAERLFAGLVKSSAPGENAGPLGLLREITFSGGSGHAEICVPGNSGSPRWLRVSGLALEHPPGHVLWRVEDFTERRRTQRALTEERAALVDFLENASIGFFSVDSSGAFESVNETLASWLGVSREELLHSTHRLADFIAGPGPEPEKPWSAFSPGFEGARGEVTLRRADGSEFQAAITQTLVGDPGDGEFQARAVVRDLTTERDLRETLHASEQRSRQLFEEGPTGIAIVDLRGTVIDGNRAFREMCGRESNIVGHPVIDLVAPENRDILSLVLGESADGKEPHSPLDVRFANNAGSSASLSLTRLEGADGSLSGHILHLFDTTQHRRLEAQFTQSQKMQAVGQLAGGIAHDFNNLLTVMIGFCDLILQRYRPGEQTFADIMQIKQNANRAANLVRQLLAFSRQQTLQPKVLNITDILAELSNLLRRLIGVNIKLDVIHSRDLGLVRVDQVQLEQVIINLVVNARDAMRERGGTLTVRTSNVHVETPVRRGADVMPPGDYVKIEIADTGTGIAPEHLEHIFEPFFSTKEVGAGTGLGLSTVYGIVTQTGGFVQVDSAVGLGATFSIFLPRHDEEPAAKEAPKKATRVSRPVQDLSGVGTVLLVEDEDPVRLFGSRALRNKGYKVLEAKNGDAALAVLNDSPDKIDLVISDVVMPYQDGPTLIRAVRERYPHMKVIFISGYAEDQFRESLEREPGIHFLAKPFSLDQLAGKVKEVMTE